MGITSTYDLTLVGEGKQAWRQLTIEELYCYWFTLFS